MKRADDFSKRREHLAQMSDEQLEQYFWQLADKLTAPLIELGRKNTSPAIERSVLLRMGFSSLEVKPLVEQMIEKGLISHGAGHIVYRVSLEEKIPLRDAGLGLIDGKYWQTAEKLFKEVRA